MSNSLMFDMADLMLAIDTHESRASAKDEIRDLEEKYRVLTNDIIEQQDKFTKGDLSSIYSSVAGMIAFAVTKDPTVSAFIKSSVDAGYDYLYHEMGEFGGGEVLDEINELKGQLEDFDFTLSDKSMKWTGDTSEEWKDRSETFRDQQVIEQKAWQDAAVKDDPLDFLVPLATDFFQSATFYTEMGKMFGVDGASDVASTLNLQMTSDSDAFPDYTDVKYEYNPDLLMQPDFTSPTSFLDEDN